VSTDKVDTEVPSAHAGFLREIRVPEGDTVAVGGYRSPSSPTTADEPLTAEATVVPTPARRKLDGAPEPVRCTPHSTKRNFSPPCSTVGFTFCPYVAISLSPVHTTTNHSDYVAVEPHHKPQLTV